MMGISPYFSIQNGRGSGAQRLSKIIVVKVFVMFRDETSDGACSCEIEDFFYWLNWKNDVFQRSWSESVGYEKI